jgi:hypothetical protein
MTSPGFPAAPNSGPHTSQAAGRQVSLPTSSAGGTGMAPPGRGVGQPTLAELTGLTTDLLVKRYRIGVENFAREVFELNDAMLDTAFRQEAGVGRWPCRVLLGHVADAELAFVHRMRRTVAEEGPVFGVWDENAFIDSGLYGTPENGAKFPIGGFVATLHTLRAWTGQWLTELPATAFDRVALHPERGEQTLRLILQYATWHLEHHAWFLNKKVARLLGRA